MATAHPTSLSSRRVLALDLGRRAGWALIDCASGKWITEAFSEIPTGYTAFTSEVAAALGKFAQEVDNVLDGLEPSVVVLSRAFYAQKVSATMLGHARLRGIVLAAAGRRGICVIAVDEKACRGAAGLWVGLQNTKRYREAKARWRLHSPSKRTGKPTKDGPLPARLRALQKAAARGRAIRRFGLREDATSDETDAAWQAYVARGLLGW